MQRFQLYLLAVFVLCVGTCVAAAASAVSAEGAGTPGSGAVHGRIREFKLRHAGLQKGTVASNGDATILLGGTRPGAGSGAAKKKDTPGVTGDDTGDKTKNDEGKTLPGGGGDTKEAGSGDDGKPNAPPEQTGTNEEEGAKGSDPKTPSEGTDPKKEGKPGDDKTQTPPGDGGSKKDGEDNGTKGEDSTEKTEPKEETTKQEDKEEGSSAGGGGSPSKPSSKPGQGGSNADGQASVKAGALCFVLSIGVALCGFL